MPIMFDYECADCGTRFEHLKMNRSEPDPECPGCAAVARKLPPNVNLGTNKGLAMDLAYKEVEAQGFTDMKDNLREGDTSVPSLPAPLQRQVDGFWGGGGKFTLAQGKQAAAIANAEGSNPIARLQQRKKALLEASK